MNIFDFVEHGSLTIVRRSNSRKDNLLQHQQLQDLQQSNQTPRSPADLAAFSFDSVETTFENFQFTDDFENMQATSVHSIQHDDAIYAMDNVELATDNLPAVDTPDACDKAAFR